MTKVAYNDCYDGGFGLSHEAVMRYAEIKGIKLYPEETHFKFMAHYYTAPKEHRQETEDDNRFYFSPSRIERDDPALIQVIEELGKKANGRCASLKIMDIFPGTLYRIDEYDGNESVMTQSDYLWRTA
jgi:hypothetical protein